MNIIINKGVLEDFVKSRLREARSSHTKNISEIPAKPDDEPIVPREQMALQLSVDEPPVGDPEFVPASLVELGNAASVIAREVPSHQLEFFYRKLHKLLDRALDREEARIQGPSQVDTGIQIRDEHVESEKLDKLEKEEVVVKESIRRFLLEQDEEFFSPAEQDNIEVAYQGIKEYLDSVGFGYTSKPGVLGGVSNLPYTPELISLELRQRMGPDDFDPRISQLFATLSPVGVEVVRARIIKYYSKVSRKMPGPEEQAQIRANKIVDMEANKMLGGDAPMSPEEVAAEFIRKSESESDQFMINAYQEIAQMLLSKSGAAAELKARAAAEREIRDIESSELAAEEEVVAAPKDLSDLWTQIAKEEGFASAAGARQFAFKPMIKYYLESMAIPPDVMDTIKARALKSFKRGIRSFNLGLDTEAEREIMRSSRWAPKMSGDVFRTYFKLIFFQPFVNDFLKRWKTQAGIILTDMGIQDTKQMFAKMLIGETSPDSKSAKDKIAEVMTSMQWLQALEGSRAWSGDPANSASLAQQYANRIDEPVKVKNSIQKALSQPEV